MKPFLYAAGFALAAVACTGRPRSKALDQGTDTSSSAKEAAGGAEKEGEVLEFDLSNGVPESQAGNALLPVPASRTYAGLVRELERAATSTTAKGFFLRLGEGSLGWAHAEELGMAFSHLREKSGKPIVCHAHELDNRAAWFLGRACSRVWVSPAGDVSTVGIAAQVVYLKGAMDKLKVRADFLHMGRYKSAAEALTQEGPSEAARESLTAVLSSIRQTWLETYASARKAPRVEGALEDGPFDADEAKERGLVDAIGYESDARAEVEKLSHTERTTVAFGKKKSEGSGFDLSEILRVIAGADGTTKKPHIAIVPATGSISMGGEGATPLSERGITFKALEKVIRKLTKDDNVKAVVLRIDSPGGSALASDLLWHDLMELRKKKPLVASVGDMAASGGYYLACAANKIIAPRTSIVGSIGVVGGKIVVDETLTEFGVHAETFTASTAEGAAARAAYLSPLMAWDDATRAKVQKQMASVYELFLRRVSEGRGIPVDLIRAVAEGRIWSGTQGLKIRLVDEIGGLGKSLEVARKLASLGADVPIRVEGLGESFLENLLLSEDSDEATVRAAVARAAARPDALAPIVEPLRPFVSGLSPLARGEAVVATLPFAFVVK